MRGVFDPKKELLYMKGGNEVRHVAELGMEGDGREIIEDCGIFLARRMQVCGKEDEVVDLNGFSSVTL